MCRKYKTVRNQAQAEILPDDVMRLTRISATLSVKLKMARVRAGYFVACTLFLFVLVYNFNF
jgi:hypothetical protein